MLKHFFLLMHKTFWEQIKYKFQNIDKGDVIKDQREFELFPP